MKLVQESQVELIDFMGSDLSVVNAARVSFDKESSLEEGGALSTGDQKLIKYLGKHNHWTPFAHTSLSFRISTSFAIARQLGKHQVGMVWNECFSSDTEVLTESGWKFWPDVVGTDKLATPKLDGSSFSFEIPKSLISQEYTGELIHFYSRDLDLLTTPGHDQYISSYTYKGGAKWTGYSKIPSSEISSLNFPKTMAMPSVDLPEGDDYLEGLTEGAFLGDGSLSKDKSRIYFHIKKDRKKEFFRKLMADTPYLEWNENPQEDGYSYFSMYNQFKWDGSTKDKSISFNKNTKSYIRGVFDGLMATDGFHGTRGTSGYSTVSEKLSEGFRWICTLLGYDTTLSIRVKEGWSPSYRLHIKCAKPKLLKYQENLPYNGMVYCAETSTGLLIVRRNGKSCISGNCSRRYVSSPPTYFMPSAWRKAAENVKQGSSKEEISTLPETICEKYELNKEVSENVRSLLESSHKLYSAMIEAGVCAEQARFVLPMAANTEWVWTGSLAAFARVYNLRTDPHAQIEVQEVARKIGDLIPKEFQYSWKALTNKE